MYWSDQAIENPGNYVLYYLHDGRDRDFVRAEFMHILQDTKVKQMELMHDFHKNFISVYNGLSSALSFTFNKIDFYIVIINNKPWTYPRKMCKCMQGKCVIY